jgi:molecular chaperone DnaJ
MRDGNDLVSTIPVSFTQAALGATIEVPSLDGTREFKIPPGTQHGSTFRIKGEGLPDLRTRRKGDQLVRVTIEIPRHLTSEQEELLRDFDRTQDRSAMPESSSFFEKLKKHFGNDK